MPILLKAIGWGLIIGAVLVFVYPYLPGFSPVENNQLVITLTASGIMLALGAQLLLQAKNISDDNEKRSQFFLDSCVEAYEEARKLLLDGNNNRETWIAAGRALAHAKNLISKVTEDSHRRVLELHQIKYRRYFHNALADKPATFFYGAKDISISVDNAAELSTAAERVGGRLITSTINYLEDKSLYAVWEAAQWPDDYSEPLDRGFSDEESKGKLIVLYPGLYDYFEHKELYHSASGKLYPRNKDN